MLMRGAVLALLSLLLPLAAWAFFKPVRVLAPELNGVSCVGEGICIDDPARLAEALGLYDGATRFVEEAVGAFAARPRVVFCARPACFDTFGFHRAAANTVGTFGIVIGPRGWAPHYLRHEMIHHLQNERIGSIRLWLRTPEWFVEGMAYALSADPRATLPGPAQQQRARFEAWYRGVGRARLWAEAARL